MAGLLLLLAAFLINCYFMLFNQQSYMAFLEHFSPDGNIRDIFSVFLKVQILIVSLFLFLLLITNQSSTDDLLEQTSTPPELKLHWWQTKLPYIIACSVWLLVSYLPFLFFDYETIRMLATEDSFYEYSGFFWLLLTSISFFYLFFRGKMDKISSGPKRNISFLILSLLFFFGAGEEIDWGQRILNFKIPEVAAPNLQHGFNLHNMPLFDTRVSTYKAKDGQRINVGKTGIPYALAIANLFGYFWFSFCILIPILYFSSSKIRKWLDKYDFPITPIWVGLLFIINYLIYNQILRHFISYPLVSPMDEIREAAYSFLFFILALWFINSPNYGKRKQESISNG